VQKDNQKQAANGICILTPAIDYHEQWQADIEDFDALFGTDAITYRSWNDPGPLSGFGLILPLLAWGYQRDQVRWQSSLDLWTKDALPVLNAPHLMRWNTHKLYLFDLDAAGIDIIPTHYTAALTAEDLVDARRNFGEKLVIKPPISAGSDKTYFLSSGDAVPDEVALAEMLIQPAMPAIFEDGELSLFLFDGQYSHALLKRPKPGDFRVQEQWGGVNRAIDAPAAARTLSKASLDALPEMPLYARVDMVRDGQGYRLMELELIVPSLYLRFAPDRGARFMEAVHDRLQAPS
jgi:glutathione synthase/RimK-type ligase-like ATP-grasp enzyme